MQIFADMIENEAAKRLVEVPANATLKVTGVPGTAYHGGMRLIGADGKEIKPACLSSRVAKRGTTRFTISAGNVSASVQPTR